ncbi:hypothetical protein [Nocardia wallacei]|nr:hypothetical protein [Nocardia wallacei]
MPVAALSARRTTSAAARSGADRMPDKYKVSNSTLAIRRGQVRRSVAT